jgi:hypothetical protein
MEPVNRPSNAQVSARRALSLAMSAVLSAGLLSACGAPAAGAGFEKAVLAFAPPPGTVLTYDFECVVGSRASSLEGGNLPFQASARGDIRMNIRPSRPETCAVWFSSPGIEVTYQAGAEPETYAIEVPDAEPVRMVFSPTGRIMEVRNGAALEKSNRMNFSVVDMIGFCFPSLPGGPRSVGDSWVETRRIKMPFQGIGLGVGLRLTYTFDSLVPLAHGQLAVLSASPAVTISGSGETNGISATVAGNGAGTANLRLLADRNIIEEYRLETQIRGTVKVGSGATKLLELPLAMTLSFRLRLRGEAPALR